MTKKKHPLVDVKIEELSYPDRAECAVLAPVETEEDVAVKAFPDARHVDPERSSIGRATMKGGIPGQVWRTRVKRSHHGVKEVAPLELLTRSPLERDAECPLADRCGGCQYQTLPYETELLLKQRELQHLFGEIGYTRPISLRPSPLTTGYRSKMEYTFGDDAPGGALTLGLHVPGHFYDILPTPNCRIVPDDFNRIRAAVEQFSRDRGWQAYHRGRKEGFLRHLVLRFAITTNELMVNLVTTSERPLSDEETADFLQLLSDTPLSGHVVSVFHTTNDRVADVVTPESLELLDGVPYLEEKLSDLTFRVGPFSFFQPNVEGAKNLYAKAMDLAGDLAGKTVYDLYSGTGTLAQLVASRAQRVIGVEIVEEAVEKAQQSAFRNSIVNVKFLAANVLDELARLAEAGERPDVVFLDPPREGIHPKAVARLVDAAPRRIVYISCNPRTQVRDLALFEAGGYAIEEAVAFDQFPRTKHVETVALMSREG